MRLKQYRIILSEDSDDNATYSVQRKGWLKWKTCCEAVGDEPEHAVLVPLKWDTIEEARDYIRCLNRGHPDSRERPPHHSVVEHYIDVSRP